MKVPTTAELLQLSLISKSELLRNVLADISQACLPSCYATNTVETLKSLLPIPEAIILLHSDVIVMKLTACTQHKIPYKTYIWIFRTSTLKITKIMLFCNLFMERPSYNIVSLLAGSNHYGIAGFYALQAMEVGLLVRVT